MRFAVVFLFGAAVVAVPVSAAQAKDDNGRAFAEHAMQAYLAMWSQDAGINNRSVARFYAPHVVYYGKAMSRAQVLADKQAFIRQWPVRLYRQMPGTFAGGCNRDLTRCTISSVMTWRRVDRSDHASAGRVRIQLEFVPVEGTRKIARESAQIL